ncbi:MAG TPA: LysR family transcriptional regulator [Polyangia bacterium]|nr:LysR family transcriptional regulator [Polyangia bacterium]
MFDWDDARVFLALARRGSLSAAGRLLKVQQTTVGRRLAALEAALDARLFERTSAGYLLTEPGEALLAHAERIEEEALSAERALLRREGRIAGTVRITAPQAFGNGFLVPLLARLRDEQPGVVVELVADNAFLNLTKRDADVALRLSRPKQRLLVARRLGEVATGLYAARDYLRRRGRPGRSGLTGHDYVDYDETFLQKDAMAWLRRRTRGARCVLRVNGTPGIAAALGAGMGVGPLPCWLGDATPGLERVLAAEGYVQELWLVVHRDLRQVARIRAVAGLVTAAIERAHARLLGRGGRRHPPLRRAG